MFWSSPMQAGSEWGFAGAGGRLVTHTQWRDVGAIVAVDVDGASPPGRLTPQDGNSWSLLDCQAGAALAHLWHGPAIK